VTHPIRVPDAVGAVILDMDGVVRHWRPDRLARWKRHMGWSGDHRQCRLGRPRYQLWSLGVCTFADWLESHRAGAVDPHRDRGVEAVARWRRTGAKSTGIRWRSSSDSGPGCPSMSLSNAHDCFIDDVRQLGVSGAFDGFTTLPIWGSPSPTRQAYLEAWNALACQRTDASFVDDHTENVVAARSVAPGNSTTQRPRPSLKRCRRC